MRVRCCAKISTAHNSVELNSLKRDPLEIQNPKFENSRLSLIESLYDLYSFLNVFLSSNESVQLKLQYTCTWDNIHFCLFSVLGFVVGFYSIHLVL